MKILILFLLLVAGGSFAIYHQREHIAQLDAQITERDEKIAELQGQLTRLNSQNSRHDASGSGELTRKNESWNSLLNHKTSLDAPARDPQHHLR